MTPPRALVCAYCGVPLFAVGDALIADIDPRHDRVACAKSPSGRHELHQTEAS